jgi:hypothetical protein
MLCLILRKKAPPSSSSYAKMQAKRPMQEQKDGKKSYIVRESNASFVHRVVLPEGADADNISAELNKGLLKVTIPVNRPEAKRIQIKAGNSKGKAKLASLTNAKSETK